MIDSDMIELYQDFISESEDLVNQLYDILDQFDEDEKPVHFEQYGQVIDRIMGAAKSLGWDQVGQVTELGKLISYKASQSTEARLLAVTSSILYDALDLLSEAFTSFKENEYKSYPHIDFSVFLSRMEWLSGKFSQIERASCQAGASENLEQDQIDQLLKLFGS